MNNRPDTLIKRNLRLTDRRTSIQLEAYVWQSIDMILSLETVSLPLLTTELDRRRQALSLSNSLRLFALIYFRTMTAQYCDNPHEPDMLYSPAQGQSNCFLNALQQFSQYALHGNAHHQQKSSSLLSPTDVAPHHSSASR